VKTKFLKIKKTEEEAIFDGDSWTISYRFSLHHQKTIG
jgi:hypothetical protein